MQNPARSLVLLAVIVMATAAPAPAVQILKTPRIRAPRKQGKRHQALPESPTNLKREPWAQRTGARPLHHDPAHLGRPGHDREWPTFYGDPYPRIWNGPATFGAALPPGAQTAVRDRPRPSKTEAMFGPGGLKVWLRNQIARSQAKRYHDKLEGVRLMERYRAEKAMLGLCPVDDCERPRMILEGKPFSPEGYCSTHARERFGARVEWAERHAKRRNDRRRRKRAKFIQRWHTGGRFGAAGRAGLRDSIPVSPETIREVVLQAPRPPLAPRPGDLGPNGTLPMMADPRDPAGFPYDTVDPDPTPADRVPTERRSWVEISQQAP